MSPPEIIAADAEPRFPWNKAFLGYAFFAITSVTAQLLRSASIYNMAAKLTFLPAAFLLAPLFFGIAWFWVASRILGGRVSVSESVRAAGGSLFRPWAAGLIVTSIAALLYFLGASQNAINLLTSATRIAAGIAGYVAIIATARELNGFGAVKTAVFCLWLPAIAFAILGLAAVAAAA